MGRHVIVSGYPRSGTTMLYDMLRATVRNFRFLAGEMPARRVIGATPDDCVTRRPFDIFDIDRILAANTLGKDVACIVLVRDIRDLVTSRHGGVPNAYCISFDHQYAVRNGTIIEIDCGMQHIHNTMAEISQRADLKTVSLRYETLLRDGVAVQARLGRSIGFEYRGSFRDVHRHEPSVGARRTPGAHRLANPAHIDSWRAPEHRERIIDHFSRWPQLFLLLKMYGYERDDRWFDAYLRDAMTPSS